MSTSLMQGSQVAVPARCSLPCCKPPSLFHQTATGKVPKVVPFQSASRSSSGALRGYGCLQLAKIDTTLARLQVQSPPPSTLAPSRLLKETIRSSSSPSTPSQSSKPHPMWDHIRHAVAPALYSATRTGPRIRLPAPTPQTYTSSTPDPRA